MKVLCKVCPQFVDSVMMKNNFEYHFYPYYQYDGKFEKEILVKKGNKIYILDIHVNQESGIDIARKIRKKEPESIIIFLSNYNNLAQLVITEEIMPLTFISKYDNYKEKLMSAIKTALNILGKRKHLKISGKGIDYSIPLKDILYITYDSVERKSIIITDYNSFKVGKPLADIFELLSEEFKYSHRACIVNAARIAKLDRTEKNIIFDTGKETDLLSNNYKKELKEYVNRI